MPNVETQVKLSDATTVTFKPISMLELMRSDMFASALASEVKAQPTGQLNIKAAALCSVRAINGKPVDPRANYLEFKALASDITAEESYELVQTYIDATGLGKTDEDEKKPGNEPAAS